MRANPAAPINLVEKPIHDHEQDDDGEQAGRGLQIQRRHAFRQLADDSDGDEPRDQCRDEGESRAQCDRPAMRLLRSGHARRDRGQDENAFQSFAKNEHADIEKRHRRIRVRLERIGRAVCGERLPYHHGDNASDGEQKPDDDERTSQR